MDILIDDDPDFHNSDHDIYDDDDILFDCNVTEGIEMDMHRALHDEEALEVDSSSNVSSEELKFGNGSDLEENNGTHNFPEYFPQNENRNPRLEIRLFVDGCPWMLWASKLQGEDTVQIKTYDPKHTCLRTRVRKDLGVYITKSVAWNVRKYAKVLISGNDALQFEKLGSYAEELRRTNSVSTVIIAHVENVFRGIYIYIEACKRGFLLGCRHCVSIDGCFLKGKYDGQLLATIGVDTNDRIYPIAYATVEKVNTSSWRWFVMLSEDLAMENRLSITFMSDRQKGLFNVVANLFPKAEHRFCVRHMYQNFFRSGFNGKNLKDCLWGAAKSSHLGSFKYWMSKIESANEKAYGWLMKKLPSEWSRSHFFDQSKCEMFLNNLCECFNSFVLEDKDKSVLTMEFVVDMENQTCTCRRWQISGIPCLHVIACILDKGHDIDVYVLELFKVETYMATYKNVINPIKGKELWPESNILMLPPPCLYYYFHICQEVQQLGVGAGCFEGLECSL
ncbi:uncharacterized protein LOC111381527 [Olea europaea var. sylvestris]|uniref:uncharacterized protein LOC111381527 n=1 Tax=Olea europaea var. sylvestris TaxID=158386 RepID=UPI000C1D0DBE|nr:uncharacterized protein LOC111381527 [Olea europaea var. sylvestris]